MSKANRVYQITVLAQLKACADQTRDCAIRASSLQETFSENKMQLAKISSSLAAISTDINKIYNEVR